MLLAVGFAEEQAFGALCLSLGGWLSLHEINEESRLIVGSAGKKEMDRIILQ
jgi:hypothetical protein